MSYTVIHKTDEHGNVETIAEIQNAWLGAIYIWETLGRRYLRDLPPYWTPLINPQPVWDLFKDRRLNLHERAVLGSTFDKVMVKRERLHSIAFALDQFVQWFPGHSNLAEQASAIARHQNDGSCYAIFWTQTSVADDVWWVYEQNGDWRWYDITRDEGHWFLYDALESMPTLT